MNPQAVAEVFRRKAQAWEAEGSIQRHVSDLGLDALAEELGEDPAFEEVCLMLKEKGDFELRMVIEQSIMPYLSIDAGLPFQGLIDLLVGACVQACIKKANFT
ncbi:MAG: hypothetical protein ACP5GO_02230 [Thermoprotei archaeon]